MPSLEITTFYLSFPFCHFKALHRDRTRPGVASGASSELPIV